MICEECKKCDNYKVCENGCFGSTEPCEYLQIYNDENNKQNQIIGANFKFKENPG